MNSLRRYELPPPLRFNDGSKVPGALFGQTFRELRSRFGAVSYETLPVRGAWQEAGIVYHEDLIRVFVDVPGTVENRLFFLNFKGVLKARFQQLDIWLTSYPVDVL